MEPYLGQILMFAGTFAPRSYALCDGQLLAISQNQALFSLLGTTYGGDGRTTFALPDLRGRLPVHAGSGEPPGLAHTPLGAKRGTETVTLTVSQIPGHAHFQMGSTSPAAGHDPAGQVVGSGTVLYDNQDQLAAMNAATLGHAGGTQAHTNLMPSLCINFIICLQGLFPPRD